MQASNIVLRAYPLSAQYRAELERRLGDEVRYLELQTLRHGPVRAMFAILLRTRADKLVIPLEDATSRAVLPLLLILAAFTRARRIVEWDSNHAERPRSRLAAFCGAVPLGFATLLGQLVLRLNVRELARLLECVRIPVPDAEPEHMLYLNASLWFGVRAGGSVGHISGVANAFMGRGLRLDFSSVDGRLMVRPGAELVPLPPPAVYAFPFEINAHLFTRAVTNRLARHYRKRPRPELIYQRLTAASYSGVQLSRAWGVPLILEYNGSEAWISKNWGRSLRYHRQAVMAEDACLRHAHLVVTISDVLRDELVARGVDPQRIVTYPNCIDPEIFDPQRCSSVQTGELRRELGIATDATVVTFLGTFGQWHGAGVLAQVVRDLAGRERDWMRQRGLHFLFVGDGARMPEVRAILDPVEGLREICTFTGLVPQPEAPRYLAASDVLICPHVPNADGSRFFGSPTKLFEYLAMGKAIVASDLDQLGQVLSPGLRSDAADLPAGSAVAILTVPGSVDSLAAGIRMAVDRPELREQLGANARRLALARYTWSQHVDAIMSGFAAAQGGPNAPRRA